MSTDKQDAPKPMAFAVMRNCHECLRGSIKDVTAAFAAKDGAAVAELWRDLRRCLAVHAQMEDDGMFQLFDDKFDGACKEFPAQHEEDHRLSNAVDAALEEGGDSAGAAAFQAWAEFFEGHMQAEENVMMKLTMKTADTPAGRAQVFHDHVLSTVIEHKDVEWFMGHVAKVLEKHADGKPRPRVFVHGLQSGSTPSEWARFMPAIKAAVSAELWAKMVAEAGVDGPGMVPEPGAVGRHAETAEGLAKGNEPAAAASAAAKSGPVVEEMGVEKTGQPGRDGCCGQCVVM